jgi:ribose transport system ATP-binding protein
MTASEGMDMGTMGKEILRAVNISKAFGVTQACQNISFSIDKGEVHGLIGENGSGKSTFSSILCGVYGKDSGTFLLDGKPFEAKNIIDANAKGVSMIVQEMGTLNGLTVAQNIFLGKEDQFTRFGILDKNKMNAKVARILNDYGLDFIKPNAMIEMYDYETRKLIEIVKATHFGPKLVVVDETTTALSQEGRTEIYARIKKIKEEGNSVLFISHDLEEVIEVTDRISILRDGEFIATVNAKESNEDELKMLMVGRKIEKQYYRSDYDQIDRSEVVLKTINLSVERKLHNLNFTLYKGEILGIGGLSDCGMHNLAKALFGAEYNRTGEVLLGDGTKIHTINDAIKNNIAYTSKDRDNESVILNSSIKDNICLLSLKNLQTSLFISDRKEVEFAAEQARRMSVKMENVEQFVSSLSGGNKQKVVLARWLGREPKIMILDSPTRGIDVKVKADIYALMNDLRRSGVSIIMISEELMELLGMCDRILILKNGVINGEFFRNKKLEEKDLIKKMI